VIVILQRVKKASVSVDQEIVGAIEKGLLVLLGIEENDTVREAELLAKKSAKLRIFNDENGKMNRSLLDEKGRALVVSQFTLCADWQKGRRPSFIRAAKPEVSKPLVAQFIENLKNLGIQTESGKFGAMMDVMLVNEGPVTIVMNSAEKR